MSFRLILFLIIIWLGYSYLEIESIEDISNLIISKIKPIEEFVFTELEKLKKQ
ncbi:MAG TPA: hypothetical protein K8U92_02180 [Aliarcobacter thereius]|nr:hypothetical protein [Aliarcobacter thereius]HJE02660.1 hypothetical protein [Aliarcobacter thereius]